LDAAQNALTARWSNDQAEEQISRLRTLKQAMYGMAGGEMLRGR